MDRSHRPVQWRRVQERPAAQLPAQQVHGSVRQHRALLPVLHLAGPVSPQEVARPEPGDLRNHAVRHTWGDRVQDCWRQVQPGVPGLVLPAHPSRRHLHQGTQAAEGLTRGDFTKSATYTVAFAVIGVAGPNVVGKNKNTPYCGPRNRRDRTMLNQPGARARCGGRRRQCDAVGPAGGKHVTQSGFGFAGPRP